MPKIASSTRQSAGQIKAIINKYCSLWHVDEIQDEIQIVFSKRLTRSLGRTQPLQKVIRLNVRLLNDLNSYLEEVICHELAHVAATHISGPSIKPHGKEWQKLVCQTKYEPTIKLMVKDSRLTSKPRKRFKHSCLVCHSERIARTKMTRWRCKTCVENGLSGQLKIEEIT